MWHPKLLGMTSNAMLPANEADASQLEADIPMQQAAKSLCYLLVHRVGNECKKCTVDDYTTGWHEYLRA